MAVVQESILDLFIVRFLVVFQGLGNVSIFVDDQCNVEISFGELHGKQILYLHVLVGRRLILLHALSVVL